MRKAPSGGSLLPIRIPREEPGSAAGPLLERLRFHVLVFGLRMRRLIPGVNYAQ